MVSYHESLEIIRAACRQNPLPYESVSVTDIPGRVSAMDIHASVSNPPFDNAAMDGFALNSSELQNAASGCPVSMAIAGHIAAGELRYFESPGAGQCYEIMTGAPIPPGCNAVVPVEKTSIDQNGNILFHETARENDNIRRIGADLKAGDKIVIAGTFLQPAHVLALATFGIGKIDVVRKAKIALISTGKEVVDSFNTPLQHGQIYNSTKPYLVTELSGSGVDLHDAGTMGDDPIAFKEKLQKLLDQNIDICISTGAVSAGAHDFVPSVLRDLGAEIFFHKVSIRPGKPVLFAKFPDKGPFYVGLPGNPAATAAGLRFFVMPLLHAMQGIPPEDRQYAVLKGDYSKGDLPLRFFMRANLSWNVRGICEVEIPQRQQSFMVSPFTNSNCWAVIPEDVNQLKAGDVVEVCQ